MKTALRKCVCALGIAVFSGLIGMSQSFAVSGIGICTYRGGGVTWPIGVYTVENDIVVDTFHRVSSGAYSPVINTYGTHVAFIQEASSGWDLVVMSLDKNITNRKVLKHFSGTGWGGNYANGNILDWPRGDWVWYMAESKKSLCRINVHTQEDQELVQFIAKTSQWTLASNGPYMCSGQGEEINGVDYDNGFLVVLPDIEAGEAPLTNAGDCSVAWGQSGGCLGGNCGFMISPSGTYYSTNLGSGHAARGIWRWDHGTNTPNLDELVMDYEQWNRWGIDRSYIVTCTLWETEFTLGLGIPEPSNRFSRNSDKWMVVPIGWPMEGRFADDGCNLCIINWQDSLSLNITKFPRVSQSPDCSPSDPAAPMQQVFYVDFWLSGPAEDIEPGLLADAQNRNFGIKEIDGATQTHERKYNSLSPQSTRQFRIVPLSNSSIEISSASPGTQDVELLDVSGKRICRFLLNEKRTHTISALPAGTYMLHCQGAADAQIFAVR